MDIFTIGFTKKSAAEFFGILMKHKIRRLIDVRLNNVSQLAGFTKRDDFAYFLDVIGKIDYIHEPQLAPTQKMLDTYKKEKGSWSDYEKKFLQLMMERKIESTIDRQLFEVPSVMLCSEPTAKQCHRRLVAEYLQSKWKDVTIYHL